MATEYGFVYVLGNFYMPDVYKIGFTTNHPKVRLDQLSSATGCPAPFDLYACFGTPNPKLVEQQIHDRLSEYRINPVREFFNAPASVILDVISYFFEENDLVLTRLLDNRIYLDHVAESDSEKNWKIAYFHEQNCDPIFFSKSFGNKNRGFS